MFIGNCKQFFPEIGKLVKCGNWNCGNKYKMELFYSSKIKKKGKERKVVSLKQMNGQFLHESIIVFLQGLCKNEWIRKLIRKTILFRSRTKRKKRVSLERLYNSFNTNTKRDQSVYSSVTCGGRKTWKLHKNSVLMKTSFQLYRSNLHNSNTR